MIKNCESYFYISPTKYLFSNLTQTKVYGSFETTKIPIFSCLVSSFFKQEGDKLKDDDLYKHLQDLKKAQPKLKQLKTIKGKTGNRK